MHLDAFVITQPQAAELMQQRERLLHHVTQHAQPAAMLAAASGQPRLDLQQPQRCAVRIGVVAAVAEHHGRSGSWAARLAANWADLLDQRQQLRDVVAVGLGDDPRQRRAIAIDRDVVL